MKILHIITSLELGGAEKLITELIPLQKEEAEVDLLVLFDRNNTFIMESMVSKYNSKRDLRNIWEILKIMREGEYDIVHAHLIHAQFFTGVASIFDFSKRRRYLTTEHSTSNRRRERGIFRYFDRALFSRYLRIVTISQAVRESLMKWLGDCRIERYPLIENGIDLEIFRRAEPLDKKELGIEEGEIALIMVSRMNRAKDHITVIKALKNLPENYKLFLAGDGETKEEIMELVEELKLCHRVSFLGIRGDIASLFKSCDVAIQSSHFEGFGITAVEAMASGIPLIATDVPGLSDVVRDAGVLFPLGDSERLVQEILKFEKKTYRDEVIEKELKRGERYSLVMTAKKYLELYREIL